MSDLKLRQAVIDELAFEPSIDARGIGVAVEKGVVTLTGHVSALNQKTAVEAAVWRVKGVKALAQELQVRLPADKKLADDEIAQRAVSILAWNATVPRDAIRITVEDGVITLSGTVEWDFQRTAAVQEVRKLSGVVAVVNYITLQPVIEPADVRQRIADALKRTAEVEADRIRIDVHPGGRVTIDGEVDNWDERQAVERAVWSTPGIAFLEDRIRIA